MAEFVGHAQGVSAAEASLREEERMAAWIDTQIAPTSLTYMERIKAGVTADH
jgi:ferritin-like metal-binding protein YciE